ncbi:MAG: UDP-N-acetylmuramoyl-L-alanine--D-glutamate ligase [Opitutaceae bacterium]|nr:UDP-N-acetylmuramoyl-L-alanine--D-glutamate ligase [Opitutaceae bacterium]
MPLVPPDFLLPLLQRPVAIFGAGVSGQGVITLLKELGGRGIVYDEMGEGERAVFTGTEAARHGLVIASPGFVPTHPWLAVARAAGCTCLGELDLASLFWPEELVAITGTNGKTTLAEFLAHALRENGRPAEVTGNVGYPFSRFVVEQAGRVQVAVCEVSSFQAETLRHLRPTATLWTNFAEDHLERHTGMADYFAAKWRLVEQTLTDLPARAGGRPTGALLVGSSVQRFARQFGRELPAAACLATEDQPADPQLAGTVFAGYPQRENFLLAAAWWRQAGLPGGMLYTAARSFKLGKHRLARVVERRGVTFWNDSKATNFHAVEAALATFDRPVLWIGGGKAKGGDLGGFVRRIRPKIRHAFLIGETRPELARHCREVHVPATTCTTLDEAVRAAFALAGPGNHILLSPGFASFDMFRGYDDRGLQFEKIVDKL